MLSFKLTLALMKMNNPNEYETKLLRRKQTSLLVFEGITHIFIKTVSYYTYNCIISLERL